MSDDKQYFEAFKRDSLHYLKEKRKENRKKWIATNVFNIINSLGVIAAIIISIFALLKQ